MLNEMISYQPIGIITTPYKSLSDMPIQPSGALIVRGELVVNADLLMD